MAVDLDALAAELRAAGFDVDETKHELYPSLDAVGEDAEFSVFGDGLVGWRGDCEWTAIDIIRRHVSPEPSRRAAVDTEAVMAAVKEYGDARLRYRSAREKYPLLVERAKSDAESSLAAIRAMLEPHDAARLRETIAEIIARKAFRWNESVVGIPYRSMSEEDRCKDIADAVIRAIGGER